MHRCLILIATNVFFALVVVSSVLAQTDPYLAEELPDVVINAPEIQAKAAGTMPVEAVAALFGSPDVRSIKGILEQRGVAFTVGFEGTKPGGLKKLASLG